MSADYAAQGRGHLRPTATVDRGRGGPPLWTGTGDVEVCRVVAAVGQAAEPSPALADEDAVAGVLVPDEPDDDDDEPDVDEPEVDDAPDPLESDVPPDPLA